MSVYSGPEIVNDGLVLYLDAANPRSYSGSGTTWYDLSNNNNGTLINGVGYNTDNKGSILFDRINDNITVTPVNRGITTSIEAVFRLSSVSTNLTTRQYIYTQQQNPPTLAGYTYQQRQGIHVSGNKLDFQYFNEVNNAHYIRAEFVLEANKWYHCITTLDYNVARWFINGIETEIFRETIDSAFRSTNRNAKATVVNQGRIGLRGDPEGNDYFGGSISILRDYNRALTDQEIKQNFEATRGRYGI
jgi:hypothetical protein